MIMNPTAYINTDGTYNMILVIILATLIAIVWAMRYLVIMQRTMARIEKHIEKMISKTMDEEGKILKEVKSERKELEKMEKYM